MMIVWAHNDKISIVIVPNQCMDIFTSYVKCCLIVIMCSFQTQNLQDNVGGGIPTRIFGVEGEHVDHLTTAQDP